MKISNKLYLILLILALLLLTFSCGTNTIFIIEKNNQISEKFSAEEIELINTYAPNLNSNEVFEGLYFDESFVNRYSEDEVRNRITQGNVYLYVKIIIKTSDMESEQGTDKQKNQSSQSEEYKVVYNSNGKVLDVTKKSSFDAQAMLVPTLEGYTFDGWYLDQAFANKCTEEVITTELKSASVNLYAKWIENAVVYNSNGKVLDVTKKSSFDAQAMLVPTLEGYTFDGWYLDQAFANKCTEEVITTELKSASVNLYAKWREYEVIYYSNGDILMFVPVSLFNSEELLIPELEGFAFDGWYFDQAFSEEYSQEELSKKWINSSVCLYANWAPLIEEDFFRVYFRDYYKNTISIVYVKEGEDAIAPIKNPTRKGYRFIGWNCSYENVKSDLTVDPIFETEYCIDFYEYDSTLIATEYVISGESVTVPQYTKNKEGYKFVGWKNSDGILLNASTISATIKDATYTACFEIIKCNVKFVAQSGDWDTQTVKYGFYATVPERIPDFYLDNNFYVYEFVQWNDIVKEPITEDTTIDAVYRRIDKPYFVLDFSEVSMQPSIKITLPEGKNLYAISFTVKYQKGIAINEVNYNQASRWLYDESGNPLYVEVIDNQRNYSYQFTWVNNEGICFETYSDFIKKIDVLVEGGKKITSDTFYIEEVEFIIDNSEQTGYQKVVPEIIYKEEE